MSELEWGTFKLEALAWGVAQQETEIDVEHVSLDIDQDVLVVPVFDLEDIANKTVSTERVCKVLNSGVVLLRVGLSVLTSEVVDDCRVRSACLLLDRRNGESVSNNLNETASGSRSNDFVWFQPER